jgi:RNA polymerase sigma factor (sigma-70 family)
MAAGQLTGVLHQLRKSMLLRERSNLRDEELLREFVSRRDHVALEAILHRHGAMVWGVCRRVLSHHHDAEDAFQATFLVLVRRAASIASPELLANWLYGVAHQTALKGRATAIKRKGRERQVADMPDPAMLAQEQWNDVLPLLDQELSRLPDIYRAVIVLCDLEGKTRKEASQETGVPEGTIGSRLARARELLRRRLKQRGIVFSGGSVTAALLAGAASASAPPTLVASTVKAASLLAAGRAAGAVSTKVTALSEEVVKTMFVSNLKNAVSVGVILAVLATGTTLLTYRTVAGQDDKKPSAEKPVEPPAKQESKRTAPVPKASKTDEDLLRGKWTLVSGEVDGEQISADSVRGFPGFLFAFDRLEFAPINKLIVQDNIEASYKLDPSQKPKVIEIQFSTSGKKGQLTHNIFRVDGDRLLLCLQNNKEVPTDFVTKKGDGRVLLIFERAEKQPAPTPPAQKQLATKLSGRFIFEGDPPAIMDLFPALTKIDPAIPQAPGPDGRFSGVESVYRDFLAHGIRPKTDDPSLLVGKKGGVANVVIWAASKDIPWKAPEDLGQRPVKITLKGGNYSPRVAIAAVGQPVLVENHDPVAFHFRVEPARPQNKSANQLLKPNAADTPLRLTWEEAETIPVKYASNLGPWANGWLFVHRNAFVAVSGADGSFSIPDLPSGEWEFRVWHERAGYLKHWPKGVFKLTVKPGDNSLGEIKLKPELFGR